MWAGNRCLPDNSCRISDFRSVIWSIDQTMRRCTCPPGCARRAISRRLQCFGWGSTAARYIDEPAEKSRVHVKVHTALAKKILYGLVEREFDVANLGKMQPLGNPDRGMSHMMMYPHPYLIPNNDIPCIAIMLNEYHLPLPTANRCWQLGRALADILKDVPERVAIYASGGLSHDPIGPRAGWVDEPLDRWFLDRLAKNEHEKLKHLFTFDSDTLRGGTGYTWSPDTADADSFGGALYLVGSRVQLADVSSAFAMETLKFTTALPLDYGR